MSLLDRVAAYLEDGRTATVPEIARAVRARDIDVRKIVTSNPRFERRPAPTGRVGQARFWGASQEPVPAHGTSSPAQDGPGAGQTSPRTAESAYPAWWLTEPRSVGEAIRAAGRRSA